MKTQLFFFLLSLGTLACAPSYSHHTDSQTSQYRHFTDLADALRQEPGLRISGVGRNITVQLLRSSTQAGSPVYFLNGIDMGQNYNHVNDALHMPLVRSIRVSKRLSDRTVFGRGSTSGIIEIWTY